MKEKNEKIKVGWTIPEQVKEDFVNFCTQKGTLAQEDCAGALVVWQSLPAQLREWAKDVAKGKTPARPSFWNYLLPKAIENVITPMALSDDVLDKLAAQAAVDSAALEDMSNKIRRAKPQKQTKRGS